MHIKTNLKTCKLTQKVMNNTCWCSPFPPPHVNWAIFISISLTWGGGGRGLAFIVKSTTKTFNPLSPPYHCQLYWVSEMYNVDFSVTHCWFSSLGTRPVHTRRDLVPHKGHSLLKSTYLLRNNNCLQLLR